MAGYPDHLELGPFASAVGELRLPGSKSISNRVLLLAALAHGSTEIYDLLCADDVDRMLESLEMLGVRLEKGKEPGRVTIDGCGGPFPVKSAELFLGNAGTAFRPMTAALALCGGHYRLSGAARMHERPIGDLVDALRQLGAELRYLGKEGLPPLEIQPGKIRDAGTVRMRGEVSSQFLTALLMALPLTGKQTTIEVIGELISRPYVEITLNVMARFGVQVRRTSWTSFTIPAGSRYRSPGEVFVEGDASGASYFLAAGAIAGGPVRVDGVGRTSVQGDVQFASVLAGMGARIEMGETWIEARAPATGRLRSFDLDLNHIPDAAMTLAVTALFADGRSRLRNIASWRVKETDRITAMATELRKVGAIVEEGADYLVVTPPDAFRLTSLASIDTYDDHRMAMCFALVAFGGVQVRINNPECVAKTFPDFFDRFAGIAAGAPVPVIAIDGPSASGKGTVSRQVAQRIGFHYLDSGALYRLVALAAMRQGIAIQDAAALGRLAHSLPIRIRDDSIGLGSEDVTEAIRAEDVSALASKVAAISEVRQGLIGRQRAFRRPPGLVADGRDMGTVVFPDAALKVFLTASAEERALRRYKQLIDKGFDANLATLLQEISQRDSRDSARSVAPLQKSVDAQVLDTTGLSVKEAVAQVVQWFESVQRRAPSR